MRRWLRDINTQTQYGSTLQAMNYSFDLAGNILGYSNTTATYSTSQSYGYDSLYQLTSAQGTSSSHPSGLTDWTSTYQQSFSFDAIGNMTKKTSSVNTMPSRSVGDGLNYSLGYSYYAGKAHQAEIIGDLYYRYDANGNTIEERQGGHGTGIVLGGTVSRNGDLRMTDLGFGLVLSQSSTPTPAVYARYYVWDEENRLERTVDGNITVDYRYGADGQRAVKYSSRGESLYFDSMWQAQTDAPSLRQSKHIYVGSTRIATQLNIQGQLDVGYENVNTYYYHPDHLGSSQLVTDYQGNQYEHIEYTPYGESWIDQETDSRALLPFKFTSKELDSETGLYYYGARYLNPKTSRWVSADPALGDYLPEAPTSDEARKRNGNLPGMGGVFNLVNMATYHYAGNN
ncbi:MAG TPA: RHS repeat-associated core domain-containing protein, partial [Spirochaetia bacterium]|nr:RHS repeat-associated core domain-containing protein [Spirochaetia bacterium]